MFTGIIEEIGTVKEMGIKDGCGKLVVKSKILLEDINLGDSIAVNGVCLTVKNFSVDEFSFDVMAETVRKTNLSMLKNGDEVNLERAMASSGRLGGHIVTGHIDGVGKIINKYREKNAVWLTIRPEKEILDLVVNKGSVALDGISLTVAKCDKDTFSVSIIPHTGKNTIILNKDVNDVINIENDIIGKYIKNFVDKGESKSKITKEFLSNNGFM